MPVKRRSTKLRRHKISTEAREIFNTSKGEQITLFDSGAGLICNPELARALNLPEYVVFPDMRILADELFTPPLDEGTSNHVRPRKIRS